MQRTIVQVTKIRFIDTEPGDIVNGHPDSGEGWYEADEVRTLPNGDITVANHATHNSITGGPHDLLGLQVHKTVEMPPVLAAMAMTRSGPLS